MRRDAYQHALCEFPRESCGVVIEVAGRAKYWPCDNLSNATSCFMLSPHDYAAASDIGEVVAVVHSHPQMPSTPSAIDVQACEASGLPWHIVSVPEGRWSYLEPRGCTEDLIGRQWVHAVSDCYTLVRDWYRISASIYLGDYSRQELWWEKGDDLYLQHFADEGFIEIKLEQLRPGDAILMRSGSKVTNHAAIYLGDNVILHHVQNRLSGREMFDESWRRRTTHCLRYVDDLAIG
jgi:proteasome lid subunit RPN8/RPN11